MSKFEATSYFDRIASKATGLQERIDHYQDITFTPAPEKDFERILTGWKQAVAAGEEVQFDNRLKNDSITPEMLTLLLGEPSFDPARYQPEWLSFFIKLKEFLNLYHPDHLDRDIEQLFGTDHRTKIPYIELITPFVAYASGLINDKVKVERERHLGPEALLELHQYVARLISHFAAQTFHLEFQVFQNRQRSSLWGLVSAQTSDQPAETTLYDEFTRKLILEKFDDFFEEYATLARILSIILGNVVNNTSEFLTRLDTDYQAISDYFHSGNAPGRLKEYKTGISDLHDHGKSVVSLEFESGLKLIYKPKNLELEQAWSDFLAWFNDHGLQPTLRPLDVLPRGPYGWVGFVESAPCESLAEVADFYRRIGSLVALIYLLNGNDCHHENLIASGSHPVIIDLESILHHDCKSFIDEYASSAVLLVNNQIGNSVFRTGLLPSWISGKEGYAFDISGIGGYDNGETPYKFIHWENINTDRMGFNMVSGTIRELTNLPMLNGVKHLPAAYQAEIMEGFGMVYSMLLQYRFEIPIHLFENREVRFIFRATRIYGLILKKLMNPKFMRSGLERGIQMELLSRAFIHTAPPNPFWNICRSELRQMEAVDFPIFRASSGSTDLCDSTGVIVKDFLDGAVYRHVQQTLQDLTQADLQKQLKFIRASLFFRDVSHGNRESVKEEIAEDHTGKATLLTQNQEEALPGFNHNGGVDVGHDVVQYFLDSAMTIAGDLRKEAIFSKDGSCAWMAISILPGTEKYSMRPTSMDLYDGLAGIALFLSALYKVTGDRSVRQLTEATMQSFFRVAEVYQKFPGLSRSIPIGVTSGLSSVVYALTSISAMLEDRLYLEKALEFSHLTSPEMIAKDVKLDVMSGSAGCALAMLDLFKASGDSGALDKATLCGNHLLEKAAEQADGSLGWITINGKMLTGFSHGAAGIAYALLKLYEITRDEKYLDAAIQGIRYENSQFSDSFQNWYDLRDVGKNGTTEPRFMVSWCHGAPGIGLARAASLHLNDSPEIRGDISAAMKTTLKAEMMNADHLCCGNLGRAETLFFTAIVLHDESLLKEAYNRVFRVMERTKSDGHYHLFHSDDDDFFNPGFFQGVAGIGYHLLRMAYPEKFPSVLLFE